MSCTNAGELLTVSGCACFLARQRSVRYSGLPVTSICHIPLGKTFWNWVASVVIVSHICARSSRGMEFRAGQSHLISDAKIADEGRPQGAPLPIRPWGGRPQGAPLPPWGGRAPLLRQPHVGLSQFDAIALSSRGMEFRGVVQTIGQPLSESGFAGLLQDASHATEGISSTFIDRPLPFYRPTFHRCHRSG